MKKAVVLISGGIDSAVTLYYAKNKGYKCFPLMFNYGQRHIKELVFAKKLAVSAGFRALTLNIKMPWKGSALLDARINVPNERSSDIPVTYVPGRNIIFMSYALSYAESINAEAIFIGAHSEDYSGYPDCRKEFFDAFKIMKNAGTKAGKRIKVLTPILHKKKKHIIKLGIKLGVPFAKTWSCYKGGKKPCLTCDSCFYRMKGFEELGLRDPLVIKGK